MQNEISNRSRFLRALPKHLFILGCLGALIATSGSYKPPPQGKITPTPRPSATADQVELRFFAACSTQNKTTCPQFFPLGQGQSREKITSDTSPTSLDAFSIADTKQPELLLYWPTIANEMVKNAAFMPPPYLKFIPETKALAELGFVLLPSKTLREKSKLTIASDSLGTVELFYRKPYYSSPVPCVKSKIDPGFDTAGVKANVYFYAHDNSVNAWMQFIDDTGLRVDTTKLQPSLLSENIKRIQYWTEDLASERQQTSEIKINPYGVFVKWKFQNLTESLSTLKIKSSPLARDEAETRPELAPIVEYCISDATLSTNQLPQGE